MATKNLVNELFVNSGRPEQGDNRSYFVRALNKVLSDGFISVAIAPHGRIWNNKNYVDAEGNCKPFTIEIRAYGWVTRSYMDDFTASDLIKLVGKHIQIPQVAEQHKITTSGSGFECVECSKCYGKGIIPAFSHYCKGICFDCYGSKYQVRRLTITV